MVADERHGAAMALHANINRDAKARPAPYRIAEFLPWRDTGPVEDAEPVLLDDPDAQSDLIRAALFGKKSRT